VAWSVDNKEARQLQIDLLSAIHALQELNQIGLGEPSGNDLLRNTTGFASLDVRPAKLVKNERFASIDVTHDTNNWASQLLLLGLVAAFAGFFEALELSLLALGGFVFTA